MRLAIIAVAALLVGSCRSGSAVYSYRDDRYCLRDGTTRFAAPTCHFADEICCWSRHAQHSDQNDPQFAQWQEP